MAQMISGPGVGLPPPQALYPSTLNLSPYTAPTNRAALKPASTITIPAGQFIVGVTGVISALQYLDPVRLEWVNVLGPGAAWATIVKSDGFNWRVCNLSDSWYTGIVTAAGSGYSQASTTVTAGTGNSTWNPIIGGAIGTITVVTAGSGYTMTPTVFIPSPPAPGIAATALATLSTGTISTITVSGAVAGAGYLVAPPIVIVPDPTDPALAAGLITNGTATCVLTGAGTLTGLLLKNAGQPLTTAPTLTVNGVGASATATTSPATVVAAANDTVTIQPAVGP
jgi:hypothetical protein